MLQSWDGVIRVFPAWPKNINANFRTLRAEGAFLVSASWQNERVQSVSITSECGKFCRVVSPWLDNMYVLDEKGEKIATKKGSMNIVSFETKPGYIYHLRESISKSGGNREQNQSDT